MKKTVGMARMVTDSGYIAIIVDVIVLPEFQGKGIGKMMMNMVMKCIKNNLAEGEGIFVNLIIHDIISLSMHLVFECGIVFACPIL